jgi:hypothetical protein
MKEQKLAELIKGGYPYVKDEAGLAPWVLPEHGLNRIVDKVGDDGILKVSRPLGLTENVESLLKSAPDPANVSQPAWQEAVKQWQPLSQVRPVVAAFLEVAVPVMAKYHEIKPKVDPMVICRSLAVLLFAPFIQQGQALLGELAGVLGRPANDPGELIKSYARAVIGGDITALEKVNQSIVKYSAWQEWASALQEQALGCRHTPKLIAVTPPLLADLTGVLAILMKEGHDESGRENPRHPGEPVTAQ